MSRSNAYFQFDVDVAVDYVLELAGNRNDPPGEFIKAVIKRLKQEQEEEIRLDSTPVQVP